MGAPAFSEFTYGFALTHSLVKVFAASLGGAPIFPSLQQEGSQGGGFDLKLPLQLVPLFLQFKVPGVMVRSSALRPSGCSLPYYRLHLRTRHPNQHALLLSLEASEPLVFYVAPRFHEDSDLDSYFMSDAIHSNSFFIKPSAIGPLGGGRHHVTYQRVPGSPCWIHSQPKRLEGDFSFDAVRKEIDLKKRLYRDSRRSVSAQDPKTVQRAALKRIAEKLRTEIYRMPEDYLVKPQAVELHSVQNGAADVRKTSSEALRLLDEAEPEEMARRIAFFAQVHLGLTMGLVDADESN